MKEAMNHLDLAFGYVRELLVSHENVERVANAKMEIAAAYTRLEALEAEKAKEEKEASDGPAD